MSINMKESPIFIKTYDLMKWLLQHTQKFPKSQRFVLALRVQDSPLNFYETLIAAVRRKNAADNLLQADSELEKLRHHLRLCRDLQLLSIGRFNHAARIMEEIGKLLGAWLKKARGE